MDRHRLARLATGCRSAFCRACAIDLRPARRCPATGRTRMSRIDDIAGDDLALNLPLDGRQLIEASAGTGKTWTIAGLYARLIVERRLPVRQLLVMTFTRAATEELRQRLRDRLSLCATLAGQMRARPDAVDTDAPDADSVDGETAWAQALLQRSEE